MDKINCSITVLDVGARYGIHPSYAGYLTELNYIAFEPDKTEVTRLIEKYKNNSEYTIHPFAIGEKEKEVALKILAHHGLSTILSPNNDSAWFSGARENEGRVERVELVPMTTLDIWCEKNNVEPDFLKIDTEGYDYYVLKGSRELLNKSIMGVRCEVFFHDLYHDVPLFDDVLRIMTEHGFILANLAYSGKGTHQSFFCPGERWGMLTACEAVFIKNPLTMQEISPLAMLKFLIFCLKNDLPDVAYKFIEDNLSKFELARNELEKRKVFAYLDFLFQHATNKLKYAPGTSFQLAVGAYRRFFGKSYLDLHNFNESLHLNP